MKLAHKSRLDSPAEVEVSASRIERKRRSPCFQVFDRCRLLCLKQEDAEPEGENLA